MTTRGAQAMPGATAFLPLERTLPALAAAAAACEGCDLFKTATQTVFGAGPGNARIALVGEQPGDHEDQAGMPFVGPAGRVLDRALVELGLSRDDLYITNAVKHFKWTPKGKRRIHETPRASEIRACRPWLEAELAAIAPRLIVCLGSIAVRSLLGPEVRLLANRGRVIESDWGPCLLTVHPSSILRISGEAEREAAYTAFTTDLRRGLVFLERATV